jgi:hypothetical protein
VRARRAASLSLATQIFKLYDAGHTVDEIAAIVSRRPISIIHFAAKRGVFISRSTLVVRRAVLLSREREDALRRLADDYGTQAMEALGDLLTFSLDEDAAVSPGICMRGECAPKAMTRGESRPSWVAACRRSGTCSAPWAGRRWVISPSPPASRLRLQRRS